MRRWLWLAVVFAFAASLMVGAETYSIDWFKIAGGGGASVGGVYQVSGTIGQHDAGGPMAGGSYSLTGGFWSLTVVVQTSGSPTLNISLTSTNTPIVSWSSPSTDFVLQQNSDIGTTNWTNVGITPNDNGTTKSVVLPANPGNQFYRLKK